MRKLNLAWACLLLAGCTALGLAPAQSLDDRLAYAYATHTAVLDAAATAVNAGELSSADGEWVLVLADESRLILDAVRSAAEDGDVSTAEGRLALASNILLQLQDYLRTPR